MVIGSIKRLSKVARDFNVGISTIVEFLHKKGFDLDTNPNNKITDDAYHLLEKEYKGDVSLKKESEKINLKSHRSSKESISLDDVKDTSHKHVEEDFEEEVIIKGHTSKRPEPVQQTEPKPAKVEPKEVITTTPRHEVEPVKVVGKIDLENLNNKKKVEEPVVAEEKPKVVQQIPEVPKVAPEATKVIEKPVEAKEQEPQKEHL